MILVASIPHTGTMFTFGLLPFPWGNVLEDPKPGYKYQLHLNEPRPGLVSQRMQQCFTIVPLREYAAVRVSWERRRLDTQELDRQWSEMLKLRDVFFFQIDAPDREARLGELSRELGVPLVTDWRRL